MPPIRTTKKNQVALSAFFKNVNKDQAIAAMVKASPEQAALSRQVVDLAVHKESVAPVSTQTTSSPSSGPNPAQDSIVVRPKKRLPRPISSGIKVAHFNSSKSEWDGQFHHLIGTSTRTISFGYAFVLTDSHIDGIYRLGNGRAFQKLANFVFERSDVSYAAHNECNLSDAAIIRIAKASPNLKKLTLQSCTVGDEALRTLFQYCPDLTSIEVTTSGNNAINGEALDALRDRPQWCPNLKKIILGCHVGKSFMKSLRELGKAREKLIITLVERRQVKKWGDWELETSQESYRKGRKLPWDWNLPKYNEPHPGSIRDD
ncbi:hypothetical protein BDV96DRAFT_640716 [Lophiotrema nucula]|uniref:F-box domain-containing protein n=1 Tax=Lophiotrema nucula TaxID=690887 RepID=A0A6A5ZNQ4_9PLEO|nr:hypothetical protein BDV96DRAFT_640716 [Lophiotrema nucula]